MSVVTISAAFGAGGSEIGPAVAEALGLPFIDRAIPVGVARRLGLPLSDVEARDEKVERGIWRLISSMALVPDIGGATPIARGGLADERTFKEETEAVLREVASGRGGVVLGRAGAVVLADAEPTLHVRLAGSEAWRIADHARRTGIAADAAARELRQIDSAREAYVRQLYHCDPTDPRYYHLMIDSTVIPWDAVTDIIVRAARARSIGVA